MQFVAFGVDIGNLRKMAKQGEPLPSKMKELLPFWNQILQEDGSELQFKGYFRKTGNFLLATSNKRQVAAVTDVLAQVLKKKFAVFLKADFESWLPEIERVVAKTPKEVEGRRWTPGLAMNTNPDGGIPPKPKPDKKIMFGDWAISRIRLVWKGDILIPGKNKLHPKKREGGWGNVSRQMKMEKDGVWTARSLSSVEGILTKPKGIEDLTSETNTTKIAGI